MPLLLSGPPLASQLVPAFIWPQPLSPSGPCSHLSPHPIWPPLLSGPTPCPHLACSHLTPPPTPPSGPCSCLAPPVAPIWPHPPACTWSYPPPHLPRLDTPPLPPAPVWPPSGPCSHLAHPLLPVWPHLQPPTLFDPLSSWDGVPPTTNVHFNLTLHGFNLTSHVPLHAKMIFFTSRGKIPKIVLKQTRFHQ